MTDKEKITNDFIKNFVQKDRIERTTFELSKQKSRHKFVDRLNHNWDKVINMQLLTKIDKGHDYAEKIQQLLKFKDDDLCYVISNYGEYDDKLFAFEDIFSKIYTKGLATLLINTLGDTLFLDTEQEQGTTPRFIGRKLAG